MAQTVLDLSSLNSQEFRTSASRTSPNSCEFDYAMRRYGSSGRDFNKAALRLQCDQPPAASKSRHCSRQHHAFQIQERFLVRQPAAVTDQTPVAADDPMTGHYDRDRISAIGKADRSRCCRTADGFRNVAVARCPAERDFSKCLPDLFLKIRAVRRQRQAELF